MKQRSERVSRLSYAKAGSYDEKTHTAIWVHNSGEWDRDGERISGKGITLAPHVNVIDTHDAGSIRSIIGTVEGIQAEGEAAVGPISFSQKSPIGVLAEALVREGTLGNASLRFNPFEWENADGTTKVRKDGDFLPFPELGRVYTKCEELELSLLSVPSNAGARVRMAKAFGIEGYEDDPDAWKHATDDHTGKDFDQRMLEAAQAAVSDWFTTNMVDFEPESLGVKLRNIQDALDILIGIKSAGEPVSAVELFDAGLNGGA